MAEHLDPAAPRLRPAPAEDLLTLAEAVNAMAIALRRSLEPVHSDDRQALIDWVGDQLGRCSREVGAVAERLRVNLPAVPEGWHLVTDGALRYLVAHGRDCPLCAWSDAHGHLMTDDGRPGLIVHTLDSLLGRDPL